MDLLTAGFPCQTFSQRGEQAGFDDPRGELFLELARILTVRQPRAFLFENVAQLVTLDGGWRPINGDSSHEGTMNLGTSTRSSSAKTSEFATGCGLPPPCDDESLASTPLAWPRRSAACRSISRPSTSLMRPPVSSSSTAKAQRTGAGVLWWPGEQWSGGEMCTSARPRASARLPWPSWSPPRRLARRPPPRGGLNADGGSLALVGLHEAASEERIVSRREEQGGTAGLG